MSSSQKAQKRAKRNFKKEEWSEFVNLWLEWHIVQDSNDSNSLLSSNFNLVEEEINPSCAYQVKVPILALLHLAEKYNWLQVLRGPKHRPQNPYELVDFIQMLDKLKRA